jgi:hypothetical protein
VEPNLPTPFEPDRAPLNPADHHARVAEARVRLTHLLDPRTEQERGLVNWLGDQLDLQRLLVLVELVEYHRAADPPDGSAS